MKLKAIHRYFNGPRGLAYPEGTVFEADEPLAAFLMVDAPGCFEEVKAVEQPPKDKAIKRAPEDKGL